MSTLMEPLIFQQISASAHFGSHSNYQFQPCPSPIHNTTQQITLQGMQPSPGKKKISLHHCFSEASAVWKISPVFPPSDFPSVYEKINCIQNQQKGKKSLLKFWWVDCRGIVVLTVLSRWLRSVCIPAPPLSFYKLSSLAFQGNTPLFSQGNTPGSVGCRRGCRALAKYLGKKPQYHPWLPHSDVLSLKL